jgi:general secretion pathway protein G
MRQDFAAGRSAAGNSAGGDLATQNSAAKKLAAWNFLVRKSTAFTLIEIVLVITILAVLGAAAIYLVKGNVDVAKQTRVDSDIKNIVTQIKVYEARNLQPPTNEQGLKALVEIPTVEPVPERWTQLLEEVPKDPWNHEYRYTHPAKRSKADYDVFSLGADGVESADDIGNWKTGRKN